MIAYVEQSDCKSFLDSNWELIDNQFDNTTDWGVALNKLSNSNYYFIIRDYSVYKYIYIATPVEEFFYLKHGHTEEVIPTKYKFGGYILSICLYIDSLNNCTYNSTTVSSTNKSPFNTGFSHPHIKYVKHSNLVNLSYNNNVCLGSFTYPIRNLCQNLLFEDLFMNYREFLRQYNNSSPYVKIQEFFTERCSVCGGSVDQNLILDNVLICMQCRRKCIKCNQRIPRNRQYITDLTEQGDEVYVCPSCFKKCYICGTYYWKICNNCKFHTPFNEETKMELIELGINIPEKIIPLRNEDLGIDFSY